MIHKSDGLTSEECVVAAMPLVCQMQQYETPEYGNRIAGTLSNGMRLEGTKLAEKEGRLVC
jgi:hypothetical protein